jgi:feruloyl-CoA synthase
VPVPGVELKAVPVDGAFEARLRGPNITPGYWRDDGLTRASFDEEGYYRLGDAIDLANGTDASDGFVFKGRIAEDFKLSTGTFVRVGSVRAALLAHLSDLAEDVVITGHGRDFVGCLLFPNVRTLVAQCGVPDGLPVHEVLGHPAVAEKLRLALESFAAAHPGSSTCVRRVALLEEGPVMDAHEITAKGSLNQKAVLARRSVIVDQLYGAPGTAVIVGIPEGSAHS